MSSLKFPSLSFHLSREALVKGVIVSGLLLTGTRMISKSLRRTPNVQFDILSEEGNTLLRTDADLFRHCLTLQQYATADQKTFHQILKQLVRILNAERCMDEYAAVSFCFAQYVYRICEACKQYLKVYIKCIERQFSDDARIVADVKEVSEFIAETVDAYQFNIALKVRAQLK